MIHFFSKNCVDLYKTSSYDIKYDFNMIFVYNFFYSIVLVISDFNVFLFSHFLKLFFFLFQTASFQGQFLFLFVKVCN